jgi:hypothetical protein
MFFYVDEKGEVTANRSMGALSRIVLRAKGIEFKSMECCDSIAQESIVDGERLMGLERAMEYVGIRGAGVGKKFSKAIAKCY